MFPDSVKCEIILVDSVAFAGKTTEMPMFFNSSTFVRNFLVNEWNATCVSGK